MYDLKLSGKKALVTGASRGLSRGIAEAFARAGIETVLTSSSDAVTEAAGLLRAEGCAVHSVRADLGNADERERLFNESLALLGGKLDILVNNAGMQIRHRPEEFPLSDWEWLLEVNLTAVFDLCRLAGGHMLAAGHGKIINIASMLSFFGGTTVPAYAASKGGVAQLTKALSNDWAGRGLCVNAIAPGYMETDMNEALLANPVRYAEITARIPAGRWGKPEDVANAALFLASGLSDYVSGAVIPVDGGYLGR